MNDLIKELQESLDKREIYLLSGHNDEVLNDRIKELRNLIENAD